MRAIRTAGRLRTRLNPMRLNSRTWPAVICALCCLMFAATAVAGGNQEMRSLDEQVQEVKSDVLSIAAELNNLEEKLLYPSDTQVAVFVALAEDDTLDLGSAEIKIDGELVASHVYSFKELEALRKGGIQRIHTGNISTGEHRLDVTIAGKSGGNDDALRTQTFTFSKGVGPKLIEVNLSGMDSGEGLTQLGRR